MRIAQLQLERSYVGELHLTPATEGEKISDSITVDTFPEYARNAHDKTLWLVTLLIKFHGEGGLKLQYEGSIKMIGLFRIMNPAIPEDIQKKLVGVNAPGLLYTGAREVISMLTSRGPRGTLSLPTASFSDHEITGATEEKVKGRKLLHSGRSAKPVSK